MKREEPYENGGLSRPIDAVPKRKSRWGDSGASSQPPVAAPASNVSSIIAAARAHVPTVLLQEQQLKLQSITQDNLGSTVLQNVSSGTLAVPMIGGSNAIMPGQVTSVFSTTIPSNSVGVVIGPKGTTILEIRQQSGCAKIQVDPHDDGSARRRVEIIGTNDQFQLAVKLIEATIARKRTGMDDRSRILPEGHVRIEFICPPRLVRLLIGNKGATIKAINQHTGANVRIPQEGDGSDGSRPVIIIGEPQVAALARNEIIKLVNTEDPEFASELAASLGVVVERSPAEVAALALAAERKKKERGENSAPEEISLLSALLDLHSTEIPTDAVLKFGETFYDELVSIFGKMPGLVDEVRRKANAPPPQIQQPAAAPVPTVNTGGITLDLNETSNITTAIAMTTNIR